MLVALLLCLAVPPPDARPPVTLPQLPPHAECMRRSWALWRYAEHIQSVRREFNNDGIPWLDGAKLIEGIERDSWTWCHAATLQNTLAPDDIREEAQEKIIAAVGLEFFLAGTLPHVSELPWLMKHPEDLP